MLPIYCSSPITQVMIMMIRWWRKFSCIHSHGAWTSPCDWQHRPRWKGLLVGSYHIHWWRWDRGLRDYWKHRLPLIQPHSWAPYRWIHYGRGPWHISPLSLLRMIWASSELRWWALSVVHSLEGDFGVVRSNCWRVLVSWCPRGELEDMMDHIQWCCHHWIMWARQTWWHWY